MLSIPVFWSYIIQSAKGKDPEVKNFVNLVWNRLKLEDGTTAATAMTACKVDGVNLSVWSFHSLVTSQRFLIQTQNSESV